jgi:hypothetical protein
MVNVTDRVLLLQMEVSSLERDYRNPLMWIFFRRQIRREIDHKRNLISILLKLK